MAQNDEDELNSLRVRVLSAMHRASQLAHKGEQPIHIAYFAALSTGLLDYHLIAGGAAIVMIVALLPGGE